MCALLGLVFLFSDLTRGLSLLGLAALLGIANFAVLKMAFKRFSKD
jgi:hypothetical protein